MAGIQDFVALASKQLNIGEDKARTATGGLLGAIQGGADPGDFQKLLGALPGAASLLRGGAAPVAETPARSGFAGAISALGTTAQSGAGGVMGAASGLVGGKAGGALGLLGSLQGSGLNPSKGGEFVKLFLNFVKDKAGAGLLASLTSKMPELAKFAS